MDVSRGAQLGPYVVDGPLGSGGMGEVWRARNPRIGRTVAIKVLPRELRADEDRLRRFEQEARAVGALSHPNLLVLFDVGVDEGVPYLAMELLEGESLGPARRRRVADAQALRIAADVARGPAAAHDAGIVHRDVKPDNLFITVDGRVEDPRLRRRQAPAQRDEPARRSGAPRPGAETVDGAVIGTPAYMAPEQLAGAPVDARVDLFALGVVLYEMLTGAPAVRVGDAGRGAGRDPARGAGADAGAARGNRGRRAALPREAAGGALRVGERSRLRARRAHRRRHAARRELAGRGTAPTVATVAETPRRAWPIGAGRRRGGGAGRRARRVEGRAAVGAGATSRRRRRSPSVPASPGSPAAARSGAA